MMFKANILTGKSTKVAADNLAELEELQKMAKPEVLKGYLVHTEDFHACYFLDLILGKFGNTT